MLPNCNPTPPYDRSNFVVVWRGGGGEIKNEFEVNLRIDKAVGFRFPSLGRLNLIPFHYLTR